VVQAFLGRYTDRLEDLDGSRAAYQARLLTLGRRVRVEQAGGVLTGVAIGVDPDGRLRLRTDDETELAVAVGDVVHVRTET